jgi:hypothetical protein
MWTDRGKRALHGRMLQMPSMSPVLSVTEYKFELLWLFEAAVPPPTPRFAREGGVRKRLMIRSTRPEHD